MEITRFTKIPFFHATTNCNSSHEKCREKCCEKCCEKCREKCREKWKWIVSVHKFSHGHFSRHFPRHFSRLELQFCMKWKTWLRCCEIWISTEKHDFCEKTDPWKNYGMRERKRRSDSEKCIRLSISTKAEARGTLKRNSTGIKHWERNMPENFVRVWGTVSPPHPWKFGFLFLAPFFTWVWLLGTKWVWERSTRRPRDSNHLALKYIEYMKTMYENVKTHYEIAHT